MKIKVLGPGCKNCVNLEKNTRAALAELGLDADVEKVTDYGDIAAYGVMKTPGLVIDEENFAVKRHDQEGSVTRNSQPPVGWLVAEMVPW